MIRLSLRVNLLVVIFCSLILGARIIGHTNPNPLTTLKDYQCTPQPCWHGISPGRTSLQDAEALIEVDTNLKIGLKNTTQTCWVEPPDPHTKVCVNEEQRKIYLFSPPSPFHSGSLLLGDAINLFGTPIGLDFCAENSYSNNASYVLFALEFPNGIETWSYVKTDGQKASLTPLDEVTTLFYVAPGVSLETVSNKPFTASWQGFVAVEATKQCP